jgi:hypothetical protein
MTVDIWFQPQSFHIALQGAADRGNVRLVEELLKLDGINPNFGSDALDPPLLKVAIVRSLNCSLLSLIGTVLIQMLEIYGGPMPRHWFMPAQRDMYLLRGSYLLEMMSTLTSSIADP